MPGSAVELELRPKPLGQAFLMRFGETADEARRRLLTVALPAASVPLFLLVARSYQSAQEDGIVVEAVRMASVLLVVAALVGVMLLAHARQRVSLTADELVVRTLWRTRRHPRHAAHRAESRVLIDLPDQAPATFVLDKWGNCLVALSWTQFERMGVERLLDHLGVDHDEQLLRDLTLRQMRRRYPGAFTFSRRHPWITGFLVFIPILAVAVLVAYLQTR